ncbi:unnamed protein product [Prunus armeniaca]
MGKKRKSKTPKVMQDNIAVGIGGSFLDPEAIETARGRQLHFCKAYGMVAVSTNLTMLKNCSTSIKINFLLYEQSSQCKTMRDISISYASAAANAISHIAYSSYSNYIASAVGPFYKEIRFLEFSGFLIFYPLCWLCSWFVFSMQRKICKAHKNTTAQRLELGWLKKHSPYSGFRDYVRCILFKYLVQVLVVGLANVDPIDVARNITGLNPETTLEMAPFSSPPRLPWGLKWWLSLVDLNKTPNTAKQIETKLQFVDLRRQIQRLSKQQGEGNCICNLANVDPIDVARNITGLNPETTLDVNPYEIWCQCLHLTAFPEVTKIPLASVCYPGIEPLITQSLFAEALRCRMGSSSYSSSRSVSRANNFSISCFSSSLSSTPSPESNHLPPAPSKVPPHPRPCLYRGSGIPPSSSPTSHLNPTVPPCYAPNGSPYSPSASPYTSPSSQFLQAESLVEIQFRFT